MTTPAPSENPAPPQLFVEVRGFLELVKAVDDQGNPTDQQPLLLKLINAPPPMTPAEAEEIRNEVKKAQEGKVAAEQARLAADEERAKALDEVKTRLEAIEADKKKADEANAEKAREHEEAARQVEEQKKAAVKAQEDAAKSVKHAEQKNSAALDKLKQELEKLKTQSARELKAALAKAKEELNLEKTAAEELLQQARDKAASLAEEVEKLKSEKSAPADEEAVVKETPAQSGATFIEPLGTPPTSSVEGSTANHEIEKLIVEHLNWRNELEDNSNPVNSVTAAMPDGADRGSIVVEQVLSLPGNEIFPPKSYFVQTPQDDILYKSAMRSRDTNFRDRILRQLAEKRNRMTQTARPPRDLPHFRDHRTHAPAQPQILNVDPRYSGAFSPDTHYAAPRPRYEQPARAITPPPAAARARSVMPPRNGWFCCTSTRCCPEGGCCADCQSPPQDYYRR